LEKCGNKFKSLSAKRLSGSLNNLELIHHSSQHDTQTHTTNPIFFERVETERKVRGEETETHPFASIFPTAWLRFKDVKLAHCAFFVSSLSTP
jgi:hypothetical protein